MADTILVMGATGTVGSATVRALRARGIDPVAFVRSAERTAEVLGHETHMRVGDLADVNTVAAALEGIDAVLLCSGHDPGMLDQQLTAIRAISASEVSKVVKISASPVAIQDGSPHLVAEEALRAVGGASVSVRPNTFMQNFLDQAQPIGLGVLPGPEGDPKVSFIDPDDVGQVAAALLAGAEADSVVEITGPQALTWSDAAAIMTEGLGRQIDYLPTAPETAREALRAMGRPDWLIDHLVHLGKLMRDPKAGEVTDVVERITGREPRTLADFVAAHASVLTP